MSDKYVYDLFITQTSENIVVNLFLCVMADNQMLKTMHWKIFVIKLQMFKNGFDGQVGAEYRSDFPGSVWAIGVIIGHLPL